jgi:phosphoribosylformylglycinamidine synthase
MASGTDFFQFYEYGEFKENLSNEFKDIIHNVYYNVYTICLKSYIDENIEDKILDFMEDVIPNICQKTKEKKPEEMECENFRRIVIGPRKDMRLTWCTIFEGILKKAGFNVEITLKTRYFFTTTDAGPSEDSKILNILELHGMFDKMTEQIYNDSNDTSEIEILNTFIKQPIYTEEYICNHQSHIDTTNRVEIEKLNSEHGLSLTEYDITFIMEHGHKWTDPLLTIYDIAQSNSEHCRHHYFNGKLFTQNGDTSTYLKDSLFDLVKRPYKFIRMKHDKGHIIDNSLIAFHDNSSAIRGYSTRPMESIRTSIVDEYMTDTTEHNNTHYLYNVHDSTDVHFVCTAETHNFPTAVSPFQGATTGIGGRIRDVQATGRGAQPVCSSAGYCVGKLFLDNDIINIQYPHNMAEPTKVLIDASNGASDYGNKFGEPIVYGFTRSFREVINNQRREWVKPIMFTSGLGLIRDEHLTKETPIKDMYICKIGGPVYKIGLGGSTASSRIQSTEHVDIDYNAVQRGDPQMEQKMNKVIRECTEMGLNNPILSIHDQGAGGNGNVLKELINGTGANINLDNLSYGSKLNSIVDVWLSEYQESNALLTTKAGFDVLCELCIREGVELSYLGQITGDGNLSLNAKISPNTTLNYNTIANITSNITPNYNYDYNTTLNYEKDYDMSKPREYKVHHIDQSMSVYDNLTPTPQITGFETQHYGFSGHNGPQDVRDIFNNILSNIDVGSKRFLTNKVDRSVTGLIAQQQCVGPLHTPLSDYCLYTSSHFPNKDGLYSGCASAIGERPYIQFQSKNITAPLEPIEMMVLKTVEEMLFNLVWVAIDNFKSIRMSANWMWPCPKTDPYQGFIMYKAMQTLSDICCQLEIAIDGGKDSLSMVATNTYTNEEAETKTEIIKSPGSLVLTGYAAVPNIYLKTTPDMKPAFKNSTLILVERDIPSDNTNIKEYVAEIRELFNLIQYFIKTQKIIAGHDCSDGGIFGCVMEMAFAGNTGVCINIPHQIKEEDANKFLIRDISGFIIQIPNIELSVVYNALDKHAKQYDYIHVYPFGVPLWYDKVIIQHGLDPKLVNPHQMTKKKVYYTHDMTYLRNKWESTSRKLELLQCNPLCVKQEYDMYGEFDIFTQDTYKMPITGLLGEPEILQRIKINNNRKIGIIRGEGSNSERELAAAFKHAGFQVYDIHMYDLIKGNITLTNMEGIAFAGGFTDSDVLGAGTGWYSTIQYNKNIQSQFRDFYERDDTFSIGICNGCQLMAKLGWIDGVRKLRLKENNSHRFESRWSTVKINKIRREHQQYGYKQNIFLKNMEGMRFGIWTAHKEGRFEYKVKHVKNDDIRNTTDNLSYDPVMQYIDNDCQPTQHYPENPNGSYKATAALSSKNGRHLAIMPHPERSFLLYQVPFMESNEGIVNVNGILYSPWFMMFLSV